MAIPESQLDTWAHQGTVPQSRDTYKTIRDALQASGVSYADKNYEVFLQGSYGNDTNIYAESDVDVVIKLDDAMQSDLKKLSDEEKTAYHAAYPSATYTHVDFKRDVLKVLTDQFKADAKAGDKAIYIAAKGSRRKADVIAAIEFRRYYKFKSSSDQSYTEGICFFNVAGERIANYPKQHSENLTAKHQATGGYLKPMVRILKNMRSKLVTDGVISSKVAPSYFIEGLLYNVPDSKFANSYGDSFVNAFTWIQNEADKTQFVCANEQYYLLRDTPHVCWPIANGNTFIAEIIRLWNNWNI